MNGCKHALFKILVGLLPSTNCASGLVQCVSWFLTLWEPLLSCLLYWFLSPIVLINDGGLQSLSSLLLNSLEESFLIPWNAKIWSYRWLWARLYPDLSVTVHWWSTSRVGEHTILSGASLSALLTWFDQCTIVLDFWKPWLHGAFIKFLKYAWPFRKQSLAQIFLLSGILWHHILPDHLLSPHDFLH